MRSSKTGRKISRVASAVWYVAPKDANILVLNFCEQKFVQHGMIAIDCNGLFLFIFEEKWPSYASGPKFAPNNNSFWVRRLFNACNFAGLHTPQDQNELHLKRWFFFAKICIFCKSILGPLPSVVQAYTQPYLFGGRIKLIICQIRHELSVIIHEINTS